MSSASSIRSALKRRLLYDTFLKCATKHGTNGSMVLVLDENTARIVSSCMRMTDLIDNGILAVESIHRTREPLTSYNALYFLTPTPEVVSLLIKDFTPTKDRPKYQMYNQAHVYLTTSLPTPLMEQIENSKLLDFLGTLSEVNIDFNTVESRVFSLASPMKLPVYYWGQRELLEYRMKTDSFKLVSLFLTLGDCPTVRYDAQSKVSQKFAEVFYKDLNSIRKNSEWEPNTAGCVLILDRTIDLVAPLMHEFTYQAMTYDLAGTNNGELIYLENETFPVGDEKEQERRTLVASDVEDNVWAAYRHQHIGHVASQITKDLKEFKKKNATAAYKEKEKKGSGKPPTPQEMAQALRDFGDYSKMMAIYTKHFSLTKELLSKVDSLSLKAVAGLEQDLATGYTTSWEKAQLKENIKTLKSLCAKSGVSIEDKIRLVLIHLLTQGKLQQSVVDNLLSQGGTTCDPRIKPVMYNFNKLLPPGASLFEGGGNSSYTPPSYSSYRRREGEKRGQAIQFVRYVPVLWELANRWAENKLPEERFPYCNPQRKFDPTSAAAQGLGVGKTSTKSSRARGKSSAAPAGANASEKFEQNTKPYMVVFVLGGITHSEMRTIYEAYEENNVNIIIGGTEVLTPRTFLANVANITQEAWVDYCTPQALPGTRRGGDAQQTYTTTFPGGEKAAKMSLIDLEKVELERIEGVVLEKESDAKTTKKKPTKRVVDSDDEDIPELDF